MEGASKRQFNRLLKRMEHFYASTVRSCSRILGLKSTAALIACFAVLFTFAWLLPRASVAVNFVKTASMPSFQHSSSHPVPESLITANVANSRSCYHSCSIEIVESIPQNLTFDGFIPRSTAQAWLDLITGAHSAIAIAAYKSSLRGKHVFGNKNQSYSLDGEVIFDAIEDAGIDRKISIRMVENGKSKDKGDNEDGRSLHRRGALVRKTLNMQNLFGSGTMHSKFLIADSRDFYLGSANLDWRSLNQKMELGVFVTDCSCLSDDLTNIFQFYWRLANVKNAEQLREVRRRSRPLKYNMENPLVFNNDKARTEVYLATSPKSDEATWDLDALIHEIELSEKVLYVHVMDYFPMFIYSKTKEFWAPIDNAIRSAIIRGVDVKLLVAALHYPEMGLNFLKSLDSLKNAIPNAKFEARVFKVPTSSDADVVMRRERRTHNKFMVTDRATMIGTSNWSGDYFESKGTGVAAVIKQRSNDNQPLIRTMQEIFIRDWNSAYTHSIDDYINQCIKSHTGDFCEGEKDKSLFA